MLKGLTKVLGRVGIGVLRRSLEAEKRFQEECTESWIEVHDHGEGGIKGLDGVNPAERDDEKSVSTQGSTCR